MGKVVILDMGPGDILVFRTDHTWDPGEVDEWTDNMRTLLGCEILLVGPDIDVERFSAKQVRAIRRLFADPKFKASLEQVAKAIRPIVAAAAPDLAPDIYGPCGITVNGREACGLSLDKLDRCPKHGNAWAAAQRRGATP